MTVESVDCCEVYGAYPIKVNETRMNKPAQLELVGRKIRQLRRQRKLTQVELADRIGVHQSDLSRMEQGEYKVGLDTLLKILATFDLSIGDFFDESARSESVVQKYRSLSPTAEGSRELHRIQTRAGRRRLLGFRQWGERG